jgi:hypothetical protein
LLANALFQQTVICVRDRDRVRQQAGSKKSRQARIGLGPADAAPNAGTLIKHGVQPLYSPSVVPNLFATYEVGPWESLFDTRSVWAWD